MAQRYVGIGRKLLGAIKNSLALGRIDIGADKLTLPDGTEISAVFDGALHIVRIDARDVKNPESAVLTLFLESGYLDLRPLYPLWEGAKPPAKLYYANEQIQMLTQRPAFLDWLHLGQSSPHPLQGGNVRDYTAGMDSLAISSTWHPDDATLPEDQRRAHPKPTAEKRYWLEPAWYGYHPTNRSGKAKLLLQALLGRADSRDAQCALGSLRGLDTLESTLGLYSYEDDQGYALVQIAIESGFAYVRVAPLHYNRALHQTLRPLVQQQGIRLEQAEAYWLASTAAQDASPVVEFAVGPVIGKPYAYGWKLNRKGDRASLVTYERVYVEGVDRILYYVGRRYEITILEDGPRTLANRYGLRVAMTTPEPGAQYTPRTNGDLLWYPSKAPDGSAKLKCFYWEDRVGHYANGASVTCDAVPIYCWYDEQDRLQVVRYFFEWLPAITNPPYTPLVGCGAQHNTALQLYRSRARANAGFYIAEVIDKLYGDQSGSWVWQETLGVETHPGAHSCYAGFSYKGCNGSFYAPPFPPNCGQSDWGYIGWEYHHMLGVAYHRLDQYSETSSSKTVVVIPFGSAEAVYAGSLESKVQHHTDRVIYFDAIISVLGLAVQHTAATHVGVSTPNYDTVYQHLQVKLCRQHGIADAVDQTVEYGQNITLPNLTWTAYGDAGQSLSWEWGQLLSPVLYGPDANPWHRPMFVLESDGGLATYEQLDPVSNGMQFAASDARLPFTSGFSTFVGSA